MRNLLQYPITTNEISEYLERLSDEKKKDNAPGDMAVVLLEEAIKIIKNTKDYKFHL
jgi:hypothetical protein